MKKELNFAKLLLEVLILTGAVAIIAAAVYFFLVPSHASVSSISGLTSAVGNHHDPECCSSDHWLYHLRKRIWSKDRLHKYHASCLSRNF